jgi:CRISPR-associated protein Cmr5
MSIQQTLEQKRAAAAWKCIKKIEDTQDKDLQKKYGTLAQKAPADIQTGGLGQTLAFWSAKSSVREDGSDSAEKKAHRAILDDISKWLKNEASINFGDGGILEWVVNNNTQISEYRRATAESIAFLVWLKRFAEAKLP